MEASVQIDDFDRKILAELQKDGRRTNNELSEAVNLSSSQCSRRRQRLEEEGFITSYRALLDRDPPWRRTIATMRAASPIS